MANRNDIVFYLDERLDVAGCADRSHNGLQVQGRDTIKRIGLATDAALATYKKAVELDCDMLLTHHGLIWGGIPRVVDRDYEHIKYLIQNDLNLYGAHLPLDMHPELGNNAQLAALVNLEDTEPFGDYHGVPIGMSGKLKSPLTVAQLAEEFRSRLGGKPVTLDFGTDAIRTVAIVSGGGSSTLPEAIAIGVDCFVTGEGSQTDFHRALEGEINVIYIGHYYSETVGVKAVGAELEEKFDVETVFIDFPTIF